MIIRERGSPADGACESVNPPQRGSIVSHVGRGEPEPLERERPHISPLQNTCVTDCSRSSINWFVKLAASLSLTSLPAPRFALERFRGRGA